MTGRQRLTSRTFYTRLFALLAGAVTAGLAITVLLPIWQPILWALFIAALVHPVQRWLAMRLHRRNSLAAALLTVATFLVVVGPVSGLVAAFGAELAALAQKVESPRGGGVNPARLPELGELPVAGESLELARRYFGISRASTREWMSRGAATLVQALGPLSGKLVLGAVGTLAAFAIMLVILFFGLRDGEQLAKRAGELVPWPSATRRHLLEHLHEVLRAVVVGTLITASVQGVLVGVAFAVLGLPGPVVFGALAALLATVPLGGTALVWGPAVVYLLVDERWVAAALLGLWGLLLVGTIDNLLRPVLVAGRASIGTLTVFIGVIGGLAAFGVIGLILGPMILALLLALLGLLREPSASR